MTLATRRLATLHADFEARLRPVRNRHGEAEGVMLAEGWRLRRVVSGDELAAYLVALSGASRDWLLVGQDLPLDCGARCAALVVGSAFQLPALDLPPLDFRSALFQSDAGFKDCRFRGFADFDGADFLGRADFRNADFHLGACFHRTVFCREAEFFCAMADGPVDFSDATFVGYADFEGYVAGAFRFDGAKFLGGEDFS